MIARSPFPIRLLLAGCWCVANLATAGESELTPQRTRQGLLVFYTFDGQGPIVNDRSGVGKPLNLRIDDMTCVQRDSDSISIKRPTSIRGIGRPKKIVEAVKRSGELTIEAWIRPHSLDQTGPARIVTISKDPNKRNFTVGQSDNRIEARFRTDQTSDNGTPATISPAGSLVSERKVTQITYCRDRAGKARLYIDGSLREERMVRGSIAGWSDDFRIALANEITGDRPWLGDLHLIAIYGRSLSPAEIADNYKAGFQAPLETQVAGNQQAAAHQFETQIAPLLSRRCFECHDSATNEGGLDLSHKSSALRGGDTGVAIVPGQATESLLWKAVAEDLMPQDRPPLSESEKQRLKSWIDSGATWTVDYVDPAIYRTADASASVDLWVQRLTLPEYVATVETAVGVDIAMEAAELLPEDKRADGFRNTAYNLTVDLQHVQAYAALARAIVAKLDVEAFAKLFAKSTQLTDDNMRDLIAKLGKHVLRGPLSEQEITLYRGVTTTVASAGGDFREAVGMVLEAMLQSPRFLYRIEDHRGDGSRWPVSNHELASRVSYILWGAPPDAPLMEAADEGDLSDSELLRKQVLRMLDDQRARQRSKQFVIDWLDLDRLINIRPNAHRFPKWRHELAGDMRTETIEYFMDVVWKQQRPLADLLNAQFTYATPRLAEHYGFDSQGPGWQRYDLTGVSARGGLLTQGSVLSIGGDDASMVTRGLFVLKELLFSEVGDPPPGLDTTPVPAAPGRSHRSIAMQRVTSSACGGCHSRFEPLAFGLERFDGLGTYQETDEHENHLRQDGEILFPGEPKAVPYRTSAEMMSLLANSDRVSQCLTRKVIQFSLGRPLFAADAKAVREIQAASQRDGGTYPAVLTAIILSDLVQQTQTEVR